MSDEQYTAGQLGRQPIPPSGVKSFASDFIRVETFSGYKAVMPNVTFDLWVPGFTPELMAVARYPAGAFSWSCHSGVG